MKADEVVGARWALLLMAFLLAGLALAAWLTGVDRGRRSELDTFVKSTQPLPTPAPRSESDEEMDPDRDEK
ncbi:MAG: hypothetical protein JSR82_02490 [Verrucomicrobia bacterium]|nr:hypothetical protein [Verrucomicrobiota bacterium]